jgi:hypothetical protein
MLPIARGDVEQLRHILTLHHRLVDLPSSPRAQRSLMHRHTFQETMTWMDIHGRDPETVERWRELQQAASQEGELQPEGPPRRRRRRRRRVRAV